MRKVIFRGMLLLLAAFPAAFALRIILLRGVDFHIGDEWDPEVGGIFIKSFQGQLAFGDLVSLHNEHRLLIPRLLYLPLYYFTHGNNVAALAVGWVLTCATSIIVLYLIRKTSREATWIVIAGRWFVCNVLIFSPAQGENWLSGWGLANALPGLFTMGAIAVAVGGAKSWRQVGFCALLATAASYSNGCGFLAWLLAGKVLLWSDSREEFIKKRTMLIAWAVGFVLCAGLYAIHYHGPPRQAEFDPSLHKALLFVVSFLGNPFMASTYPWEVICPLIGAAMLALLLMCGGYFIFCWRTGAKEICGRMIVWFAVGGFSVGTAILGAMSRSGYGPEQTVISRYVTFSIFLGVALVNLTPLVCDDLRRRMGEAWAIPIGALLSAAIVTLQVLGLPGALAADKQIQVDRLKGKGNLLLVNLLPNNPYLVPLVYQDVPTLIDEANTFNKMGYIRPPLIAGNDVTLIQETDANKMANVLGHFDGIQRNESGQAVASGWAVLAREQRSADAVILTFETSDSHPVIFIAAGVGLPRDDVVKTLNNQDIRNCGWSIEVKRDMFPPGLAALTVRAWTLDARDGKATPLTGSMQLKFE